MSRACRIAIVLLLIATGMGAAAVWLLPLELFQDWAIRGAGEDPYAQFEAVGQAESLVWLARVGLPLLAALIIAAAIRAGPVERFLRGAAEGFVAATLVPPNKGRKPTAPAALVIRIFLLAWLVLATAHLGGSVLERTRQWNYFRTRSGPEVLPNISESNRDVIRFLNQTTPPDARILIVSDQSLFFLSYYLAPRTIYSPLHPDAAHVIPQAHQQRQLAAYRLDDLDADWIAELDPDIIVEYFEGQEYQKGLDRAADPRWVQFWQSRRQTGELPPYFVKRQVRRGTEAP